MLNAPRDFGLPGFCQSSSPPGVREGECAAHGAEYRMPNKCLIMKAAFSAIGTRLDILPFCHFEPLNSGR